MDRKPINLLFLCTGNSCRSQMAEGWATKLGGSRFLVKSAGIEAHGKNPMAIKIMQDAGIDISQQESTKLLPEMIEWADVVITVCDHANNKCPALPERIKKVHWSLTDPAKAVGSSFEIKRVFNNSCIEIQHLVQELISQLSHQA